MFFRPKVRNSTFNLALLSAESKLQSTIMLFFPELILKSEELILNFLTTPQFALYNTASSVHLYFKICPFLIVIGSLISSNVAHAAKPGVPTIEWGEYKYMLTEIDSEATSYKNIVKARHDHINATVNWDVWSGEVTHSKLLLDGRVVWEGQGSTATFELSKGGTYEMTVQACNDDGCSTSAPKQLMVADTDGSHLKPNKFFLSASYC